LVEKMKNAHRRKQARGRAAPKRILWRGNSGPGKHDDAGQREAPNQAKLPARLCPSCMRSASQLVPQTKQVIAYRL
jgi:hypothetical protein